jgi:hypothetical protein
MLFSGTRSDVYQLVASLGASRMGEVPRAPEPGIHLDGAVKIPSHLVALHGRDEPNAGLPRR